MALSFQYSEQMPWTTALEEVKNRKIKKLKVPIYWGAHEQSAGIRDFCKSSRLRLEKFLSLVENQGLKLQLQIGFPMGPETFPAWTDALADKSQVSLSWKNASREFYQTTAIPSLENLDVQSGFLSYLNELLEVIALYLEPEGPVESIELDFRVFESVCDLSRSPQFGAYWENRYQSIAKLNEVYQSNFSSFDSMQLASSFEVIYKKRPWLASFDYQNFRRALMVEFLRDLNGLGIVQSIGKYIKLPRYLDGANDIKQRVPFQIYLDPVLLAHSRGKVAPFVPEGILIEAAIQNFKLCDRIQQIAVKPKIPVEFLPIWKEETLRPVGDAALIICGKFLAKRSVDFLSRFAYRGGTLFFPCGLPGIDESLNPLDWGQALEVKKIEKDEKTYALGEGKLIVPTQTWTYGESFIEKLQNIQPLNL